MSSYDLMLKGSTMIHLNMRTVTKLKDKNFINIFLCFRLVYDSISERALSSGPSALQRHM